MQYNSPIDIALVREASNAYNTLVRLHEFLGTSPDTGSTLALKNALHEAKSQMQTEEQLHKGDLSEILEPSSSNY